MNTIIRYWYQKSLHPFLFPLLPLSWIFQLIVMMRRFSYRSGLLPRYEFDVPVIVVGNITVGGTGKTPFVIWLVRALQQEGFHPGVVSRGVGGRYNGKVHFVEVTDNPQYVGDEALLIKQNTKVPLVIAHDRSKAVEALLKHHHCDVIVSDDGLQHYRMDRSIEIVMVDGERMLGNQKLLPAGPLREPVSRLQEVDFVVYNSRHALVTPYVMTITLSDIVSLVDENKRFDSMHFRERRIHAVAGIGNPQRFFNALQQAGFEVIPHAFPDHHHYCLEDFSFSDRLPIVMTTKDAVKCKLFADERFWFQDIDTTVSEIFYKQFFQKLTSMNGANK